MKTNHDQGEKLAQILRNARQQKGLSLRELDGLSGVAANYLWQIENPKGHTRRIGAEVLGKLADPLGLDLNRVYYEVGWRKTPPPEPSPAATIGPILKYVIMLPVDLTPEQTELMGGLLKNQAGASASPPKSSPEAQPA